MFKISSIGCKRVILSCLPNRQVCKAINLPIAGMYAEAYESDFPDGVEEVSFDSAQVFSGFTRSEEEFTLKYTIIKF